MNKVCNKQLLDTYGQKFKELYLSGITVEKIKTILNISHHYAYKLKLLLNIHQERWQRVGMPEKFSDNIESLIFGTLMGDASLHNSGGNNGRGGSKYKILSICHSYKQLEYITHKRNCLLELIPAEIKPLNDKWNTYRFTTSPHPQFSEIHNKFYGSGSKQITPEILDKLTPQAIAWWFMDDGGLASNKIGFGIATCSFNITSHINIIQYFNDKYGIGMRFYNYKHDYPRLSIWGKNAIKFKELIEPHIITSMEYKIQLKSGTGTLPPYSGRNWSKSEELFLIDNFKSKKYSEIAHILNRSKNSIVRKVYNLGLNHQAPTILVQGT